MNRTISVRRKWAKQNALKFNEHEPENFNELFKLITGSNSEISEKIIQLSGLKIKKVKNLAKHFHKNAHEIRKQLKDLYYWLKICPNELAENFVNMKVLDRGTELPGQLSRSFHSQKKDKAIYNRPAKKK